jgi:hypothetical protein
MVAKVAAAVAHVAVVLADQEVAKAAKGLIVVATVTEKQEPVALVDAMAEAAVQIPVAVAEVLPDGVL